MTQVKINWDKDFDGLMLAHLRVSPLIEIKQIDHAAVSADYAIALLKEFAEQFPHLPGVGRLAKEWICQAKHVSFIPNA